MNNKHSWHGIIMLIGHLAPLLLFLILPKIGVSGQWTFAFAAIAMGVAHLLMMKGHSHNHNHLNNKKVKGDYLHNG